MCLPNLQLPKEAHLPKKEETIPQKPKIRVQKEIPSPSHPGEIQAIQANRQSVYEQIYA